MGDPCPRDGCKGERIVSGPMTILSCPQMVHSPHPMLVISADFPFRFCELQEPLATLDPNPLEQET